MSGVYVAGDGARGAATIVEGIRDAQLAVKDILGKEITRDAAVTGDVKDCFEKKGILKHSKEAKTEEERCLTCNKVCENCVDVCPNRANISIKVPGMAMNQVIHVDCKADDPADKLYDGLKKLICAVIDDYGYLITK